MRVINRAGLILLAVFSGTTALGDSGEDSNDLEQLVGLIVGDFNNVLQVANLPAEDAGNYNILHHHRVRISSPELPGYWVYGQIIEQGKPGIYRQVVTQYFRDESDILKSRSYGFADPAIKSAGTPDTGFLNALSPDQLTRKLPDSCNFTWKQENNRFIGTIDHRQCIIQSRYKDEKRQLFAKEILFDTGMWGQEGAYRENGELAFGLHGEDFYKYQRLPEAKN